MPTIKSAREMICLQEIPDEVSLGLFISNCPNKCKNCHSPWLRDNTGRDVFSILPDLLRQYQHKISCVLFMGGDDEKQIDQLFLALLYCRIQGFKTALYSGFDNDTRAKTLSSVLDYLKVGSYKEEFGGLNCPSTNQILYKKIDGAWEDITYRFWASPMESMKVELNTDKELVQEIREGLKENDGYCPCMMEQTPETKCMCKDFRENVAVGELCHCGLFRKIMA